MSAEGVLTAGAMAVAVIVWLVRLEGRVTMQAELHHKLVDDVAYIRNRIDAALGHK